MRLRALSQRITGAYRRLASPAWDSSHLFGVSDNGIFLDPSDYSTMYQDLAGTVPITDVEQPVALALDKSQGLALGPELIPNGTFASDASGWQANNSGANIAQSNGTAIYENTSDWSYVRLKPGLYLPVGSYRIQFDILDFSHTATMHIGAGVNGNNVPGSGSFAYIYHHIGGPLEIQIRPQSTGLGSITIDNISVREIKGNHAYQTTASKRPVLSALHNMWPSDTEDFRGTPPWKARASIVTTTELSPNGVSFAQKLVEDSSTNATHYLYFPLVDAGNTKFSYHLKAADRRYCSIVAFNTTDGDRSRTYFDLESGSIVSGPGSIESVGNGWYKCSITALSTVPDRADLRMSANGTSEKYDGDGVSGVYVWGASAVSVELADLAYQRVTTATDYDSEGFPKYLRFDGAQALETSAIDFTASDEMTVCAGLTKLSDASRGVVSELGSASQAAFSLNAPDGALPRYAIFSTGTSFSVAATPNTFAAPHSAVVTGSTKISTDANQIRVNGAQEGTSSADQGTGNYGNHKLYIGARTASSLYFTGHIYGLTIINRLLTPIELARLETFAASKAGITL